MLAAHPGPTYAGMFVFNADYTSADQKFKHCELYMFIVEVCWLWHYILSLLVVCLQLNVLTIQRLLAHVHSHLPGRATNVYILVARHRDLLVSDERAIANVEPWQGWHT